MKEFDIRPKALFDEYLSLSAQDAQNFFSATEMESGLCPACNQPGQLQFQKLGFSYERCPECATLYANPRPTAQSLGRFYREAASVQFWSSDFYRKTADARREKLWRPKAAALNDWLATVSPRPQWIADIGAGYGIFAEEISKICDLPVIAIEPSPTLAQVCREKGFKTIEKRLEDTLLSDLPEGRGCFTSFELFEHVQNPHTFLESVARLSSPGGYFYFTTLSGTGVDILALGKNSASVFPPHHLNFFNPKSISKLLRSTGFEPLKVETPGKLDVDIMRNNKENLEGSWRVLVDYLDAEKQAQLQRFLSENGLSSHMAVTCRRSPSAEN